MNGYSSRVIHKFPLIGIGIGVVKVIHMPAFAKIVHVHEQQGDICLWAEVDPSESRTTLRQFIVHMTGGLIAESDEIGTDTIYLGTAHFQSGAIVLHVFEVVCP